MHGLIQEKHFLYLHYLLIPATFSAQFKQDLKYLMSDNPEIYLKIEELKYNKTLFEFHLKELISNYNYWHKYIKDK